MHAIISVQKDLLSQVSAAGKDGHNMKATKLLSWALTIGMILSMIPAATAASSEAQQAAETLNSMGLFSGSGIGSDGKPDFHLDNQATRQEAITMLVKLVGGAEESSKGGWDMPFTDVDDWAKNWVGYAYAKGLTAGTSATTFGGNDLVTASQYITFVLKALGFSATTDFHWNAAWELSDKLGITDGRYNANTTEFLRSDMVIISNNALNAKLKNSDTLLRDALNLNTPTLYNRKITPLSDSAVIIEKNNIVVIETGKEYVDASFSSKASKYTNAYSSWTLDSFFFSEFPQYKNQLITAINNARLSCVENNGKIYISDYDALHFFKQYNIEFYRKYETYQYIAQEIESSAPVLTKDPVDYTVTLRTPPDSFVIYSVYNVYSKTSKKNYSRAQIQIKGNPYTNMVEGYFLDEFFFEEFPDYKYEIIKAVNNGEIDGKTLNGDIYLDAVNMIQFFRQYSIDFYHGSEDYTYEKIAE